MLSALTPAVFCALQFLSHTVEAAQPHHKVCQVEASGTNATDDTPAILEAFEQCGKHGKIVFEDTTYYVNSIMNVTGLEDVDIDIHGTLLVC